MNYYSQEQYIARIDEQDIILGKIEKWKAHREPILHRAFTVILTYKNKYVLQHRKHPVFNKCFDLSFSSHQIYIGDKLQNDLEAISDALKREWGIESKDLMNLPIKIGQIYYHEKDPNSIYSDQEIDYIYKAELKNMPAPNLDFAYGFSLVNQRELLSSKERFKNNLAPWVKKMIEAKLL